MKCPYCHYFHGWNGETLKDIRGEFGSFYRLPVRVERSNYEQEHVHACPKCGVLFIDRPEQPE